MQIYVSALLIIAATVSMVIAISFAIREKNAEKIRWYMLVQGITAGLWAMGYGLMSMAPDFEIAAVCRVIALFGVSSYLCSLSSLVVEVAGVNDKIKLTVRVLTFVLMLFDFLVYSHGAVSFVVIDHRVAYYGNNDISRIIHYICLGLNTSLEIIIAIMWSHNILSKRKKQFFRIIFLANIAILFAMLADTILPAMGYVSFPSTGFGATLSFFIMWYAAVRSDMFSLSVSNLSNYIFESGNAAILVYDEKMHLSFANKYARQLLELETGREYIGYTDIFKSETKSADEILTETIEKGNVSVNVKSKKSEVPCSLNSSLVTDKKGQAFCMLAFVYDMTKEEQMRNDVIAANQAKSNFLANMSHEIRTPINAVLGIDELIIRETKEPQILEYANNIQGAGKALLSIVNDILDFSKIESGKLDLIPINYHISSLLNDSYNMIIMRAEEKNLKLITDFDEKLPSELYGDEVRIRQICINLLTNAVKYTKKGHVLFRCYAKNQTQDRVDLCIEVTDTGMGMSKEGLDMLFTSFQRIDEKKNRNIEGTGLGLTITKQLVELMQGKMEVESEVDKGSTFRVFIPQKIVSDVPAGKFEVGTVESQEAGVELFHAPDAKILVVDDVAMNLKVFSGLLKRTEIQIETALSGLECIAKLQTKQYDMIFLDHMMPEMDGIEVMHVIKNMENGKVPVVMLTANAVEGARQQYIDEGFADYLTKPVRGECLEEMLLRHLPEHLIKKGGDVRIEEAAKPVSLQERYPFLHTEEGLAFCGGVEEFYVSILNDYAADNKLLKLQEALLAEDYKNFAILAHSVKSTSKSIGADEVSEMAKGMEFAAKEENIAYIRENFASFEKAYQELLDRLSEAL